MTAFTRRHLARLGFAVPAIALASRLPVSAVASETGTATSDARDVTLTWESPWEKGIQFANDGAFPTLNSTESEAIFSSFAQDPLANFDTWEANLDKIEEDYSTGFFVPFREGFDEIEVLTQERTKTGYTILMAYDSDDGPAIDYYEFRYERSEDAMLTCQLSEYADDFADTLASLQELVTINDDKPFTILDDDDVLNLVASAGTVAVHSWSYWGPPR